MCFSAIGAFHIAHTEKVGGGRPGIGKDAFRAHLSSGDWQEIEPGRDALVFGPLDRANCENRSAILCTLPRASRS